MSVFFRVVPVMVAICACSSTALASDARSIALGGSAIANGQGVHGAMENPASMMAMQRAAQTIHFRIGVAGEIRDTGAAIDTLTDDDNKGLINDIESEVDIISNKQVQCNPLFGADDDVCVDGTQPLSDLASQLLEVIDVVDDETLDIQASADFGMAFTKPAYPVAVNLRVMGTGAGTPEIAENDLDYIREFANLLDNDTLTLDEARNSTYLEASELGIPLGVQQPEDVLQSEGNGNALIRTQLSVGIARTFVVKGIDIDTGITPKFSSMLAYNLDVSVVDEFVDGSDPIADRFEDSEVSENSFTFDIGASMAVKKLPIRVAAVLRNVVPESIKTDDGFEFETTPQLIIGGLYQRGMLSVTGDLALNEAKVDNFETQKIALGVEFGTRKMAIRGGISTDASRSKDSTALSLGFGLGPLQFGGRLSGTDSLEAGAQMSYSFM